MFCTSFDDQNGIDAQHAKRVVQDGIELRELPGSAVHQIGQRTGRVEFVDVDGRVRQVVGEGGQIAGQLQHPGRAHGMTDQRLGVVDAGVGTVGKGRADGLALLDIALPGAGGVGVDETARRQTSIMKLIDSHHRRSEERRVGKECRSRWSPYH